ncbi:MAG: triple tyrosine motif-containing protein [Cyclobacteriaceae bacterium]
MMLRRVIFIFLFILGFTSITLAQLNGTFRSITVDDGLAQNSVWDMLQDSSGYYWFATADGLNKYDGQDFAHYKRVAGQSMTISGNTVGKLFLDSKDRVWALHNEGVSVYNRKLDQFDLHFEAKVLGETQRGIWIVQYDTFRLLDVETLSILKTTVVKVPKKKKQAVMSRPILFKECFYMAENGRVEVFNTANNEYRILDTPLDFGGAFIALNDSTLFCPGFGNASYLLNVITDQFIKINVGLDQNEAFYPTDLQWYNGLILMSSAIGLHIISPKTMKVVSHLESFEPNGEDGYRFIESIFVDKNNTLFLGTNGNGLKVCSPFENRFPIFSTKNASLDMVKAICMLENGKLVTGVYDNGLVIYDSLGGFLKQKISDTNGQHSVLGLFTYDRDRVMGINGTELFIYNTRTYTREFRLKVDSITISYPNFIKAGQAWFFNSNKSIYRLSDQLTLDKLFTVAEDVSYINSFQILGNRIYIGTNTEMMIVEDSRMISRSVLSMFMKSLLIFENRIYAASQSGLFVLTLDGELIRKHDVSTGLTNDFIYGILEDDLGYIWISHNKGLSRIDPKTNEYLQFDVSDGLQSNEFNTGAFYKHTDGKLYFGGVSGINVIDPKNLILNERPPQISLNSISLFDQPLEMDTSANEKQLLVLDYTQNTLSFDFAAPDFAQPNSCRYAYKMQGLDDKWIENGSRHYARYANLPAGNYSFQMKAANGDGVWMKQPKSIQIVIVPPYWQKVWFKLVMVLLGLLSIVGIVLIILARQKIKLRRELEIKHKLELERVRISRDLHDNVGSQLSFLITNMEWIADHTDSLDTDERRDQLKQLSDTGRQAITTLRQTIWAISQNELSVEDFADRFKQFAMKLVEFRPDIKLHFHENFEENTLLSPEVALNLFRIAQEAFNNAIKHSHASDFFITFESSVSMFFAFELKDNGMGFDTLAPGPDGHYGLSNMKARALESGAKLEINSSVDDGTSIQLSWNGVVNNAYAV